jgi:hypothetical protein
MIVVFAKPPANAKDFVSTQVTNYKLFPKTKAGWFLFIMSVILIVAGICLAVVGSNESPSGISSGIDRSNTTVTNPTTSGFGNVERFGNSTTTFKPIGYGPVIDKTKVKNWLNGTTPLDANNSVSGQTTWLDGNGTPITIPTEQFKALYGFIPPSFAYYPKGQTSSDYNGTNYASGRENCMKACALTNCTAVQTEVPENCSQKANPSGSGNSCGTNSPFSCTLFYDNIKNADDAYWTINNFSSGVGLTTSPGCFEATGASCLGKKYYEDNAVPTTLPNNGVIPSQNSTPFCDSSVTNAANCVKRPLLTTEYVQSNHPYYSLPINVSKATNAISSTGDYSMLVPSINYKNGSGSSCGAVNGKLVSCTAPSACAQGESSLSTSNCWQVDSSACSGTPFDQSSGATQLQTYKTNYANANPQGSNYDDLYPSCYYRQQLTVVQPVQFNCDSSVVTRGCWGSPPIIYTDSITSSSDVAACSDTSVIPSSQRCQNGTDLASCTNFPYSCGSNDGTNTLWVKQ